MAVKKTAQEAAQNWATNFGQAGPAYAAGIARVQTSPTQLAAARSQFWASQVAASRSRFEAGLNKVSLQQWKDAATTTGGARLASGATKGTAKMTTFMTGFLPQLTNIVQGLPPRGDFGANMNRFQAYATALHAAKGTF